MGKYLLNRFLISLVTLWIIITLTFILMHSIPGGPFTREKVLSPEILKNIEARYHFNDPFLKQYFDYLKNAIRFDFGYSYRYVGRTVNQIITEGFPVSALLGAVAILIALGLGVPAGVLSSLHHNKWQDSQFMFLAILGVSIPSFILATFLQYIFAFKLRLLPAALWGTPAHLILPVIALSAFPMAFIARLTRSSMLEVLSQDYIRTAKSKGLGEFQVMVKHVLKNALMPTITVLGPISASLLTGTFVIERIFAIPGLGRHFITSIYNRDYTVILGLTIFYAAFILVMNLLVDLLYAVVDPRIKLIRKED
jgi:oligopeptide transport system permease protein